MQWFPAISLLLSWSAFAAYLSVLATLLHAGEEVLGDGGPLWSEFGRLAGVRVPERAGFFSVAIVLPTVLGTAAILGYVFGSQVAVSILIGARLGDAAFSHVGLWLSGLSRPNPGIKSSLLYIVEGVAGLWLFSVSPLVAIGSALSFVAVIPGLWLAGRIRRCVLARA